MKLRKKRLFFPGANERERPNLPGLKIVGNGSVWGVFSHGLIETPRLFRDRFIRPEAASEKAKSHFYTKKRYIANKSSFVSPVKSALIVNRFHLFNYACHRKMAGMRREDFNKQSPRLHRLSESSEQACSSLLAIAD